MIPSQGFDRAPVSAARTYRRLLGYARPHLGLFGVGVLGMLLYAATDAGLTWFIKYFLQYAFVNPDPRVAWLVPLGALVVFLARGVGDYVATYLDRKSTRLNSSHT